MNLLRRKAVAFALGSLVLFMLAAGASLWFMSRSGAPPSEHRATGEHGVRMGRLLVAARDIPPRTVITRKMLARREIPLNAIPADAPLLENQVVGYVTRRRIERGWPVRFSAMAGRVDKIGIVALIPPGRRAIVLPMTSDPSVHRMLRVGDHVDVAAVFNNEYATVIAEDLEVLAVDHRRSNKGGGSGGPQNVTLIVTADQAERLILCTRTGGVEIRYTIRSSEE